MKTSLKYLPIWILILTVFAACGDGGEEPQPQSEYFFRFKVNGMQKEFRANLQTQGMAMTYDTSGEVYMATAIILGDGSDGTKNFVSMTVLNEEPFDTGMSYEMQDAIAYSGVPLVRIQFTYADEDGDLYNAVLFQRNDLSMKITDDASVRFSSLSQNLVEGTFSATVLGPVSTPLGRANEEIKITDGQFKLVLYRSGL
ncbi:hypothetical protein J0A67_01700 [Algoriphagus aestuariicola]|uniref:Uncharacterized protein n=1 Tax=Algoriphagus aestuariicola TaxID=1852016 RepID=A0ABS3BKM5_9BACT|nr:hypothetical protein [Algoriphagus aestuariicola]MBN7799552.1 hypothetical protein [Algoriphagus aestuariicola]